MYYACLVVSEVPFGLKATHIVRSVVVLLTIQTRSRLSRGTMTCKYNTLHRFIPHRSLHFDQFFHALKLKSSRGLSNFSRSSLARSFKDKHLILKIAFICSVCYYFEVLKSVLHYSIPIDEKSPICVFRSNY